MKEKTADKESKKSKKLSKSTKIAGGLIGTAAAGLGAASVKKYIDYKKLAEKAKNARVGDFLDEAFDDQDFSRFDSCSGRSDRIKELSKLSKNDLKREIEKRNEKYGSAMKDWLSGDGPGKIIRLDKAEEQLHEAKGAKALKSSRRLGIAATAAGASLAAGYAGYRAYKKYKDKKKKKN